MGTGLGRGSPDIVPVAESDFIFTSIGEELGMFGAAAVLMSYLLIVGAGLRIALRTDNAFEKLLAVGLTTIMGIQTFIIVAGVIKLAADRHHPAVRQLRRVVAGVELRLLALLIRLSDSTPAASTRFPTTRRWPSAGRRADSGGEARGAGSGSPA